MLTEAMTALAAAGGAAVVKAAGTDAWEGLRQQVARFLAKEDHQRERLELERLDQTAVALEGIDAGEVAPARIRQEASWQTRFEALLEGLDGDERQQAATQLREILNKQPSASRSVSARSGGVAAGVNIEIRADGGSIAGGVIHGGASIGTPILPDPSQG
jgi:hypothetical protein